MCSTQVRELCTIFKHLLILLFSFIVMLSQNMLKRALFYQPINVNMNITVL